MCRQPNNKEKAMWEPGDIGVFEGWKPGCQLNTEEKWGSPDVAGSAVHVDLIVVWPDATPEWGRGARSPFKFSILSQSVNSLFCVSEHGVCSLPAGRPVRVQWFSRVRDGHVQTRLAEGSLRGFPIKAGSAATRIREFGWAWKRAF